MQSCFTEINENVDRCSIEFTTIVGYYSMFIVLKPMVVDYLQSLRAPYYHVDVARYCFVNVIIKLQSYWGMVTITSQLCTQIQHETSTKDEVGYLVFPPFLGREDGHHLVQCHDSIYVDVPHARSPPPRAVTLYLLGSFSLFLSLSARFVRDFSTSRKCTMASALARNWLVLSQSSSESML